LASFPSARAAALLLGWLLAPGPMYGDATAPAPPLQQRLEQMDARITQLEQQLVASHDSLAAVQARAGQQRERIVRAGQGAERGGLSGIARFLQQTRFDGWVAASYSYNANRPAVDSGRDVNRGNLMLGSDASGLAYPFHPDHNSFQLDQLWFKLANEATAASRAGFGVDILYGATADALRGDSASNANLPTLYQAYAQYLAPIGPGVRVTLGRFASLIGAEQKETVANFNLTQGLLDTLLQPNNHLGVLAEAVLGPVTLRLGASNDALLHRSRDLSDGKTLLWQLGFDVSDTIALAISGLWGDHGALPGFDPADPPASVGSTTDRIGIVDAVLRWEPSAVLSTWLDFDYVWTDGLEAIIGGTQMSVPGDPRAFGVAAASRYAITPQTGFGFRAELIYAKDNFLDPTLISGPGNHTLWSLTGTLDHSLAENLVVRVEGRYDAGETAGADSVFYRDTSPGDFRRDQFVAGVQAYYRF
jgi:Putative beta-barrel porin-2, OmpL-like. bbp2